MIPVITVTNQKGGVGKSTVSTLVCEYLALYRKLNVLGIDTDMSGNFSQYFVDMDEYDGPGGFQPPKHPLWDPIEDAESEERSSIADLFDGKVVLPHSTWIDTTDEGAVDVIVAHPHRLEDINQSFEDQAPAELISRLADFLRLPEVLEGYDVAVIDTGPSRNPIFRAAIRAATHLVVPCELEDKSLKGIRAMTQIYAQEGFVRSRSNKLDWVGLVPNKVKLNTVLHKRMYEALKETRSNDMLPGAACLPYSTEFPKRDVRKAKPQTVFHLPPSHAARIAAEQVCGLVADRVLGG